MAEPPELIVAGRDAWRRWLEANHAAGSAVNLVLARKGVSDPTSLDYQDALQEALCFGWIDGRTGQRDERTFRVWFGARRPKSVWSQRNVGIVERLIAEGRMAPAGLAATIEMLEAGRTHYPQRER